jgi:DNA-directed RNA polymerase subunit RPC12/RpoP
MTRIARRAAMTTGGHAIKIGGENVNIYYAKIVYKCAECLGDLERHNMGLRCKADCNHRRFIHRDEVEKIKQQQREQMAEVEASYEIVDGQIVYKEVA